MKTEKKWLAVVSWPDLVEINKSLCQAPGTQHQPGKGFAATQQLWEQSADQVLSLRRALDICRRCHAQSPFAFFNGNTFAVVIKRMLEEVSQRLSAVEGQVLRSTVAHYVAGTIQAGELEEVLDHFESVSLS